jgi:tetratricopeptide (TPR) repeat protein
LKIKGRVLGDEHPDTLSTMNNLGITYSDQGRWGEAAELQEKVLHSRNGNLGENHPSTLGTMLGLGITYQRQGRLADAVELLAATMKSHLRLNFGGDDVAEAMTELGVAYLYQGRHEEAVELHHKALVDRRESLGERHPEFIQTLYCLAEDYRHQERWEDAAKLQEKAVSTMKEVIGEQHPRTLKAVESLRLIQEGLNGISSPSDARGGPGVDPKALETVPYEQSETTRYD